MKVLSTLIAGMIGGLSIYAIVLVPAPVGGLIAGILIGVAILIAINTMKQ